MTEDMKEMYDCYRRDLRMLGDVGEVITASELRSSCNMTVLRNLYLPKNDGYTEVDMVGIADTGLWVVENKNYSGLVTGNINSDYLTVKYGGKISRLYNPYKQNMIHCSEIANLVDTLPIYCVVIFNDKADLNLYGNTDKKIYTLSEFVKKYNTYNFSKRYSKDLQKEAEERLKIYCDSSDEMNKIHVETLRGSNKSNKGVKL